MKNFSLLVKLGVGSALVSCTLGLSQSSSYGQGRSLTAQQMDAIVKPELSRCSAAIGPKARLDPFSIIPTANAREFPKDRVARTMHGMWRGQVIGSPLDSKYEKSKEGNVDYFWIIDTARNEGLIIALRNGNNSTAGLKLASANPPKLSYLICAHEGYIPNVEKGSEIHEFVKVSDSVDDAPGVLAKATGLKFAAGNPTLSELWKVIVASGYFKSLPAVAFAGGLFKPMRIENVPSPIGPSQISMSWDSEYYGGGTTWIKFTPGVPMKGVEYTQFVGTTATAGDFLVASPGNGKLAKVEAMEGGDYDLAFDAVSFGPLQDGNSISQRQSSRLRSHHRPATRKYNHGRR
ncbi:MAG TPA: hypothetical protein VGO68_10610 [Pyrinomonadaceae bacterium]|nr:hypothetical protein [Pyrinomonadaceae bacterium]